MLGAMVKEETQRPTFAKKKRNQQEQAKGVLFITQKGSTTHLKYCADAAVEYTPSLNGEPEQVYFCSGQRSATMTGWNLKPLSEELHAETCSEVKEADKDRKPQPGKPHVESITVRMWM